MEYEIVTMEAVHVPQVAALEKAVFPDPWVNGRGFRSWTIPSACGWWPRQGTWSWAMWAASR